MAPVAWEHEPKGSYDAADRAATLVVTLVPLLALVLAAIEGWIGSLHWFDFVVFTVCYALPAFGITVGYHRLLTHRSFVARPWLRAALAILGAMAIEGPPIEWVANHRMHHTFSDEEGDPHSPNVGHGSGLGGTLRGLWHAHLGWVFRSGFASRRRYAPDLLDDRAIRWVDRWFLLWVLIGLGVPFGLGYLLSSSLSGALSALLWGGAVRVFLLHHVTFSINSLCHRFGRRSFETGDESRNLAWLAPLSFGEAWHNNHHAFPRSARHGLGRWQLDPSAILIAGLGRLGLVRDIVEISPERQERKRRSTPQLLR